MSIRKPTSSAPMVSCSPASPRPSCLWRSVTFCSRLRKTMLIVRRRSVKQEHADAELVLPFELRQKSRLRTALRSGEEVGLFLDRGEVLRGGDCLFADDGRIVRVVAAPEAVMEVKSADPSGLARAAYHLGNR